MPTVLFHRWICGCVGIPNDDQPICVEPCDLDSGEHHTLSFFIRPELCRKSSRPVSETENAALIGELGRVISDGQHLADIRVLLK